MIRPLPGNPKGGSEGCPFFQPVLEMEGIDVVGEGDQRRNRYSIRSEPVALDARPSPRCRRPDWLDDRIRFRPNAISPIEKFFVPVEIRRPHLLGRKRYFLAFDQRVNRRCRDVFWKSRSYHPPVAIDHDNVGN